MKHIYKLENGDYGLAFDGMRKHINVPTIAVNTRSGEVIYHHCNENGKACINEKTNQCDVMSRTFVPPIFFLKLTPVEIDVFNYWRRNNPDVRITMAGVKRIVA